MAWLGSLGIASVIGMIWRIGSNMLPFGKIVQIVSNIVVALTIVLLAFSVIFSQVGLELLTGNLWLAFVLFLGLGYAAASLIMELVGM